MELLDEAQGRVAIRFSANQANFFRVFTGESETFREVSAGTTIEHAYSRSGDYTVRVQAHATPDAFVTQEERITITLAGDDSSSFNEGFVSPESYPGYRLVWRDEFEGNALSADWEHQIGTGCPDLCGWGNNELQFYRRENTSVQNGFLTIEARQESFGGRSYTSSRIKTEGLQSFKFGRIDIRARMPFGKGIWPALWMLGDNISEIGWPFCGEIDIMEMIGGEENTVHGTVHWQSDQGYANFGHSRRLSSGTLADKFFVYSVIWDERKITWLLDNQPYGSIDLTPSHLDEFREPFFFLFNVAVGGNWPGNPDATSTYPQRMVVDYVRVFQVE